MQRKKCPKCGKIKVLNKYSKNKSRRDGHNGWCKKCTFEYSQTEKGKETRKEAIKRYQQTNKGKESRNRYEQSEKRKETKKRYNKKYSQFEKCKEYRKRHNQTIQRRIANKLRTRIWHALKGEIKSASTIELLGCSIKKFLAHIESQFQIGMTFKNYGLWELDHIIPCSAFNLTDPEQQRKCFNYTNLQPLWWEDNLSKDDKILKFRET